MGTFKRDYEDKLRFESAKKRVKYYENKTKSSLRGRIWFVLNKINEWGIIQPIYFILGYLIFILLHITVIFYNGFKLIGDFISPDTIEFIFVFSFSLSFWCSSLELNDSKSIMLFFYIYKSDCNTKKPEIYFSFKKIFRRSALLLTLSILPTLGLLFYLIKSYYDTPTFLNIFIYYSFIVTLILSIIYLIKKESWKIMGIYSIIGMIFLWLFPMFHPFFLITNVVTISGLFANLKSVW